MAEHGRIQIDEIKKKTLILGGERRKLRRTGHSSARGGQGKGFVLKLSWPSTAEYRMMKLKKKNTNFGILDMTHSVLPYNTAETSVLIISLYLLSMNGTAHRL